MLIIVTTAGAGSNGCTHINIHSKHVNAHARSQVQAYMCANAHVGTRPKLSVVARLGNFFQFVKLMLE